MLTYTLRQLRAALAVRHHTSFRRAADALNLSQPALSQAVADLEAQLGVRLFDRTPAGVITTPAGEAFLCAADRPLKDLDALAADVAEAARSRRGRVVVACLASVASRLMPAAMVECAERYPAVEVVVRDEVAIRVPEMIRRGEADFGVTMRPWGQDRDLTFEPLLQERFAFVCRQDHPLAEQAEIAWKALNGETLLSFSQTGGSHAVVAAHLDEMRVSPAKVVSISQIITMHALIEAGLGVAVLPRLAWPSEGSGLVVKPFEGAMLNREIGVLSLRHRSLSPAAQGCLEAISLAASVV